MRFRVAAALAAAFFTAGLPALAQQEPAGNAAALAALEAARARWQTAQSGNYRYGYHKRCDCYRDTPPLTVVTVERGAVTDVHHIHSDSPREVPARDGSLDLYWTVDDLFAKLEGAYAVDAQVRVEYEPRFGYPTTLYIDYDAALIGDETDLSLTLFEPR